MTNKQDPYYILDLSWPEKLRGVTYSGAAGTLAAATTMPVSKIIVFFVALPEFTSALAGMIAFAHFAKMGAEYWNQHVGPEHLILRKTTPPKLKL